MPLPERQQFRIKDLAKRWKMSEEDVREAIREGHFKYLIVSTDGLAGTRTRHYRITDKVLPDFDLFSSKPSESSRDSQREWHGSIHSIAEFPWPSNQSTLYIPLKEVEAFEKEYGIHSDLKSSKPNATGIAAQPGSDAEPAPVQAWIKTAKEIGKELANKLKNLSLEQIAERVHDVMAKEKAAGKTGMTGRGGIMPSAASIKRHALIGIRGSEGHKRRVKPQSWQ